MGVTPQLALKLIGNSAKILFSNGQTTQRLIDDLQALGLTLGYSIHIYPSWDQITVTLNATTPPNAQIVASHPLLIEVVDVPPLGIDMQKVSRTLSVLEDLKTARLRPEDGLVLLDQIATSAPASTPRFSIMAGLGAAALAVIFGATEPITLLLILISASLGALLRRLIAHHAHNAFAQPLAAAFLAGIVGAIAQRLSLSPTLQLIAVCPCMILVPGAHIINGSLDLARARLSLGLARLTYAGMIIIMICLGLLAGLYLGGQTLADAVNTATVPLGLDMVAAGIAVAAFGAFFSMSWRVLVVPVVIGMVAHAIRWGTIEVGYSVVMGAFTACLFAGLVATPLAHKLKLPFAALAFASVVSMMPGVFLFRLSSALIDIFNMGEKSSLVALTAAAADGIAAMMICLAIALGLILPKLIIDSYCYKDK